MFPMTFDHKTLETLPVPNGERITEVLNILKTIAMARVMPYFRNKRGVDSTVIARLSDRWVIRRMEDEDGRISIISFLMQKETHWIVDIHERIFDYIAFVVPSDPESRLGGHTPEEGKVLALTEFLLRHQVEHMLHPEKSEREVIETDVTFAMERRADDPTFYSMLRKVLADEMNGLNSGSYQAILESVEGGRPHAYMITRILNALTLSLADTPEPLLQDLFPILDTDLKTRLIVECYRRSREVSYSLMRRAACLRQVLRFFALAIRKDEKEAETVFDIFKNRWGLVYLFHELGLPETTLEDKDPEELFPYFKETLDKLSFDGGPFLLTSQPVKPAASEQPSPPGATKSLKERIEEARNKPAFSRQALEVIDKNKVSAVGHSGPKYTELIEILLAIPWGNLQRILVAPKAFEEGLNRTHYGLERPKEIVCDFFANLIWRFQHLSDTEEPMRRTGSAFLFVGPPGVGKTSLAISIAENLGIPYHKVSLGGMREESGLTGHGFTYEGSKPGAIVQGLIKMGIMNGMFIMDEADKTEPVAISTLLEILDPEQNSLFHDKFTMTTVDIDLSNCHFILTANTLETVPPPVINRCEVVFLDRYSIDEKIAIAKEYLIERVRRRHKISESTIGFDPGQEDDLFRYLIKTYTHEAGVRELERIIRTLLLRIFRKEILASGASSVQITRERIKEYLETPAPPRQIAREDRVGEMLALGVNVELGLGSIIPIQATPVRLEGDLRGRGGYLSMIHATGNIEKIMDESRKVATTAIFQCAGPLRIDLKQAGVPIHLHFMGSSTRKDGPSAGGAIALALASALSGRMIRRDVAMTGEIDTQGRITAVGGLDVKLETACDAGCKTMIIPMENLEDEKGVRRLPQALKEELQILTYEAWKGTHDPFDYRRHILQLVAVEHLVEASDIAFIDADEVASLRSALAPHAGWVARTLQAEAEKETPCVYVLYLKHADELTVKGMEGALAQEGPCVFLFPETVREEVLSRFPHVDGQVRFQVLDRATGSLDTALRELCETLAPSARGGITVSLIAPYFLLKNEGMSTEAGTALSPPDDLRIFANNYTVQGVKIKECKSALNRVYRHLSRLAPSRLDSCPFLAKRHGIYMVDLSFIPEKYRLDVKRAEAILNQCLVDWLITVETAASEAMRRPF